MPVYVEKDYPVYTVVLDNPEVRNAVDGITAQQLADAFRDFEHRMTKVTSDDVDGFRRPVGDGNRQIACACAGVQNRCPVQAGDTRIEPHSLYRPPTPVAIDVH